MTSHCSASAFGELAQTAPAAMCRSAAARLMSCTTSSYPAFCRLAAILAPIVPSPMKPTFIFAVSFLLAPSGAHRPGGDSGGGCRARKYAHSSTISPPGRMQIPIWAPLAVCRISLRPPLWAQNSEAGLASADAGRGTEVAAHSASTASAAARTAGNAPLLFLEHVLGDEGGGHRGRPAGVEGEMGDDLAQLGLRHPVIQRAFEMADELLLAAERDQGGDNDQAAVALRQARPLPDIAEQHRLGIVDQVRHDIADGIARRGGLRLGHGFLRVMLERINHVQRSTPPPPRTSRRFRCAAMPAPCYDRDISGQRE